MRIGRSDVPCAIVGVALVGLVFLPWWEFDPDREREHLTGMVAGVLMVDPPGTLLSPTTAAYVGITLTAVIALTAAAALRRPG